MSTRTVDRTDEWDTVPFDGGYGGLRDLADDEFSGLVTAGPARLFMLRGAVVGILGGDVEDFEDASGTAREAPHPALPLLAVMQERADEVRAEYYTEDTPISEVDRTLADGNFTGFIELAENVLSGDYYQVYHQGHSMSVAFVGASSRLITDDDAFKQADDEVGIYEVKPVDIEVIEIPGAEDSASAEDDAVATGAAATASATAGDAEAETTESSAGSTDTGETSAADDVDATEVSGTDAASDETSGSAPSTSTDAEPSGSTTDAQSGGPAGAKTAGAGAAPTGGEPGAGTDQSGGSSQDTTSAAETATGESTTGTSTADASAADAGASDAGASDADTTDAGTADPDSPSTQPADSEATTTPNQPQQGQPAPDHPAAGGRSTGGAAGGGSRSGSAGGGSGQAGSGGSLAPGDLETRSLPSLDPERTASKSRQERKRGSRDAAAAGSATGGTQAGGGPPAGNQQGGSAQASGAQGTETSQQSAAEPEPAGTARETEPSAGPAGEGGQPAASSQPESQAAEAETAEPEDPSAPAQATDAAESADVEPTDESGGAGTDLAAAQAEVDRLESELADLEASRDEVASERDRLQEELAEARSETERLRDRLEEATGEALDANHQLSPSEAVDETNLFIRYRSKGDPTLENAHAGDVDKAAVDENIRLEYHTSFDAEDAAVDGIAFDQFLTGTVQYRFVDWIIGQLLYEIRDTGHTGQMADLYDALPRVDRAELNGQVSVKYTENGQEHRAQVGFDIVVRDRMGNPLIVANINDSREPATESMMTDLVKNAERVGESSDTLAGAFLVTRSFFAPEALETAEEATSSGLLSRGKQKSFVNLSRTGGYHLCLVEARNDEFHLTVPEL